MFCLPTPCISAKPRYNGMLGNFGATALSMSDRQKTISREVRLTGPGLFSGEQATLTIGPSNPGSGITFIREQGDHEARIPALVENVLKRPRRTCLRNGTLHVETVEHCMAALAGLRINNATIRIAGGVSGEG